MKKILLIITFFILSVNVFAEEWEDVQIWELERKISTQQLLISNLESELKWVKLNWIKVEFKNTDLQKANSWLLDDVNTLKNALTVSDDSKKKIEEEILELNSKKYTITEIFWDLVEKIIVTLFADESLENISKMSIFIGYLLISLWVFVFYFIFTLPIRIVLIILRTLRWGSKKTESENKYFRLYKDQLVANNNIQQENNNLEREVNNYKREDKKRKVQIPFWKKTLEKTLYNEKENDEEVFTIISNDSDESPAQNYYEKQFTKNSSVPKSESSFNETVKENKNTSMFDQSIDKIANDRVWMFWDNKTEIKKKKKGFSLYSKTEKKSSIFD